MVVVCLVGNGSVRAVREGGSAQERGDRELARMCWIGCVSRRCVACMRVTMAQAATSYTDHVHQAAQLLILAQDAPSLEDALQAVVFEDI